MAKIAVYRKCPNFGELVNFWIFAIALPNFVSGDLAENSTFSENGDKMRQTFAEVSKIQMRWQRGLLAVVILSKMVHSAKFGDKDENLLMPYQQVR